MAPRIAIPMPHSTDLKYGERALPEYARAVELAGGEPVTIPLDKPPAEVMKLIERCDRSFAARQQCRCGPGKIRRTASSKNRRRGPLSDTVDELLLQDAYNMHKPVLGICYGLQILNVYRSGTLIQHIESKINHEAGRTVPIAHKVEITPGSRLSKIIGSVPEIAANSSHHQISRCHRRWPQCSRPLSRRRHHRSRGRQT